MRSVSLPLLLVLSLLLPTGRLLAQVLLPAQEGIIVPVGDLWEEADSANAPQDRLEALLCYHDGAAWYMKLPHPVFGNQSHIYQRITPGSSGILFGFELRCHNEYPGFQRHLGEIRVSVHRRISGQPGFAEQTVVMNADTIRNEVVAGSFPSQFNFSSGEEFYLGLSFNPVSDVDTMAYVTAPVGVYSGHSFFILDGQFVWWGNQDGVPFGDMHLCADVWLAEQQAFLQFPWNQLDLGKVPEGYLHEIVLPLLNQGTAPLVVQPPIVEGSGWGAWLSGPDSLSHPDSLFLHLTWAAPLGESSSSGTLYLNSNAANGPERTIQLQASSSMADLLIRNWDEWEIHTEQLADEGGGTQNWSSFYGLTRPEPFLGHGVPREELDVLDLLVIGNLFLPEGGQLQLRWSQFQRLRSGMSLHAFCWKDPATGEWQQLAEPNLCQEPWLGPENEWYTVPWLFWQAPTSGVHELGLLYGGTDAADMWFVDDLELNILYPLAQPTLRIALCQGGGMQLNWDPVLGADQYRLERVDCQPHQVLCWTESTSWTHVKAARLGNSLYRVTAWNSRPVPVELQPSRIVRNLGQEQP